MTFLRRENNKELVSLTLKVLKFSSFYYNSLNVELLKLIIFWNEDHSKMALILLNI